MLDKRVVICGRLHPHAVEILKKSVQVIQNAAQVSEANPDAHGIILRGEAFPGKLMARFPDLQAIVRHGVGLDRIDVKAARKRGIRVLNTPDSSTISVAEHTVALILGLAKGLIPSDRRMRRGEFSCEGIPLVEVAGKNAGILGLGRIGMEVALRLRALGMKVQAYLRPCSRRNLERTGIEVSRSLEGVFSSADFVSVHLPLTPETRGMVGENLFERMKPTAFLVNTSRGEVLDQVSLVRALKTKCLAGAALDVYQEEPPPDGDPLLTLENVILTPHSAALTEEAEERTSNAAVEMMVEVLSSE